MQTTTYNSGKIAEKCKLNVEQSKRLRDFCASRFPQRKFPREVDPPFDDRVRDVVLNYALRPESLRDELKYLDSMGYGCVFRDGPLLEQIGRFQGSLGNGEDHAKSFRWNKNYKQAKRIVRDLMMKDRTRLRIHDYNSSEDIVDALPKLTTHAGFEYILTGKKYKGEYIDGIFDQFIQELNTVAKTRTFAKPICPGCRLQVSGAYDDDGERTGVHKKKVRLVSMIDLLVILAELMFAKPVQQRFSALNFYVGGKRPDILHSLINYYRYGTKFWLSVDYSHYDQSIPAWMIEDAFELLWDLFDPRDVNSKQYKWLWDVIVHDFIHKEFIGPNGVAIPADNGVPSGSMFTQIIDTVCNLIMITTYLLSIGVNMDDVHMMICGDDNVIFTKVRVDEEDLSNYLKRNFGIECDPRKCGHGTRDEDPKFLSRVWRAAGAWRQPKELWAKLCYPERFRPYDKNPELSPELIVYSYILAYPLGMRDLMNVDKFLKDNVLKMSDWSNSVLEYQSGFLSYLARYEELAA